MKPARTLSDFFGMPVIRRAGVAEVIFDHYQGKPVRLFGFTRPADKTNIEIAEEAYEYYQDLCLSIETEREA